jgi:hypothetical protein
VEIMTLEQVFQSFEKRLFHFGQQIWPPDPAISWREETEHIRQKLQFHTKSLRKRYLEAKTLRDRVFKQEVRATILSSQIESWVFTGDQTRAWQQALELDQVRHELQEDRRRLCQLESQCRNLENIVRHQEIRLLRLQDKLADSRETTDSFR